MTRLIKYLISTFLRNRLFKFGIALIILGLGNLVTDVFWKALILWSIESIFVSGPEHNATNQITFASILIASGAALIVSAIALDFKNEYPIIKLRLERNFVSVKEETLVFDVPTAIFCSKYFIHTRDSGIQILNIVINRTSNDDIWGYRGGEGWFEKKDHVSGTVDFKVTMLGDINPPTSLEPHEVFVVGLKADFFPPKSLISHSPEGRVRDSYITNEDAEVEIKIKYTLEKRPHDEKEKTWYLHHNPRSGRFNIEN